MIKIWNFLFNNRSNISFCGERETIIQPKTIFYFSDEYGKLRVKSDYINILVTVPEDIFCKDYTCVYNCFNPNFEKIFSEDTVFELSVLEKEEIFQKIITDVMYDYYISNKKINSCSLNFHSSSVIGIMRLFLLQKFNIKKDSSITNLWGSAILRIEMNRYIKIVNKINFVSEIM